MLIIRRYIPTDQPAAEYLHVFAIQMEASHDSILEANHERKIGTTCLACMA
jgi:hypothetical protein